MHVKLRIDVQGVFLAGMPPELQGGELDSR